MKKIIAVQIILSVIFAGVFAAGSSRGYLDHLLPAMERDSSIADIAAMASKTVRAIGDW